MLTLSLIFFALSFAFARAAIACDDIVYPSAQTFSIDPAVEDAVTLSKLRTQSKAVSMITTADTEFASTNEKFRLPLPS
jgi:hypothetical protein